jgi:lysosomal acid lipase/cholesteryl ester hydrolase
MSFQHDEHITAKIKCFFALAPPLYIGDLLESHPICHVVHLSNPAFYTLFGTKEFLSATAFAQHYLPKTVFMSLAYQMFHYLFGWRHSNWVDSHKPAYFQFTPRPVSAKCILHWFQMARNSRQLQPFQKAESLKDEVLQNDY